MAKEFDQELSLTIEALQAADAAAVQPAAVVVEPTPVVVSEGGNPSLNGCF